MSVVNIMSGSFCGAEEVARRVADLLGCHLYRDEDVVGRVARESGMDAQALRRAMYGRPSIFNQFSHERERAVARLRLGVAGLLKEENMVLLGHVSLLVPREIAHVLYVCLVSEPKRRAIRAGRELGLAEKEAQSRVHRDDEAAFRWAEYVVDKEPWDPSLYDMRLVMDDLPPAEAAASIAEHAGSAILAPTPASRRAVADFMLAGRLEELLTAKGHSTRDLGIEVEGGKATILINKKVMMLSRLADELTRLARELEGVNGVEVKAGPGYYQADVYRKADFQLPSKVLLVDDEREFVETLSERLMLREIGSAVVYDGREALRLVAEDEPEVMVLDLKMPGIDGVEVLRRIKQDHPLVEVIILTGHGSERDKETCLQLGAFAYLEKPVDISKLSEVMQAAYEKIQGDKT